MQSTKKYDENKIVLFVDDEEMVLRVGSLMLQKLGYKVLTASKGQDAIEVLKKKCGFCSFRYADAGYEW